jgi:hypothetical protein
MPDGPANPFGLTLPLRIVQLEEAVKVMDSGDVVAAYIYVAVGRERSALPDGLIKMSANLANVSRNLLGRPRTHFGITPLLIFREVSG